MIVNSFLSQVLKSGLYFVYLFATVLLILFLLFWRPYVQDLEERDHSDDWQVGFVSPDTFRLLGWVNNEERPNRFILFEKTKPEGVLRLCTLGDSGTFGVETGPGLDYPAYLQRMIDAMGAKNVQVINFGNHWFSFSQTYLMWRDVASHYSCDIVVIMPYQWWARRDETFNHTDLTAGGPYLAYPGYLHARYALEEDGIRLIQVLGTNRLERLQGYFSFIPQWQYLRYDRSPSAIVRALLPQGKTVHNPFYYDQRDPVVEARNLYQRLIAELAKNQPAQVVVYSHDALIDAAALGAVSQDGNISVIRSDVARWFPYRAPIAHASPWGSEQTAQILLLALLGESSTLINVVRAFDTDQSPRLVLSSDFNQSLPQLTGRNLAQYKSIYLSLNKHKLGLFVPIGALGNSIAEQKEFLHSLQGSQTVALLAFKGPHSSLADSCLLSLDFRPEPGAPIMLTSTSSPETKTLGNVHYPNSAVNIAIATGENLDCINGHRVQLTKKTLLKDLDPSITTLGITVSDQTILTKQVGSSVFIPGNQIPVYKIRSIGNYPAEIDKLPDLSTLELILEDESGAHERLYFLTLRKSSEPSPTKILHPLQKVLRIKDGRAVLVQQ